MCLYGSHFHKQAEDRGGLYAQQAIKTPSPYVFVEAVMRLQLLLLRAAATSSREVLHPLSAMMDVLYYYSWIFLIGLKETLQ